MPEERNGLDRRAFLQGAGGATVGAVVALLGSDGAVAQEAPRTAAADGSRQAARDDDLTAGEAASISHDPALLPHPLRGRSAGPQEFMLEAVEKEGWLNNGTSYPYWTYNGTVPGPMLRIRVGDTVHVTLRNARSSRSVHSVDLHAATGPGGGAEFTQVRPGGEATFTFKALHPGVFVYHCATPTVAHHISSGQYGLVVVEPEDGLPEVDREFYVMQGELYTKAPYGRLGRAEFDADKLLREQPEYYVFNGAVGALTREKPLRAHVGETVRIFFGVGGPNATSSFHVIGAVFDRVYNLGDLTSAPARNVQAVTVAPGSATMVEFALKVPGRYVLVDHALSRVERGLIGYLHVEGEDNLEVFRRGL